MKKKIFGCIAAIALTGAIWNLTLNDENNNWGSLFIISIEALANQENNSSNETLSTVTERCSDGTNCECDSCIAGTTDCTPDCPCCS